jgi:uncharacterized protein (DUF2141 family)
MLKLVAGAFAAVMMLSSGAQAAVLGPDAEACAPGATAPALLVKVDGFKTRSGQLRVQLYGSNPDEFLAKGKKLRRIEMPVTSQGPMEVCIALPQPGDFAIAVRHDVDGSGKSGWDDGGGFSRNPRLSLLSLKPDFRDVVIHNGGGVRTVDVTMQYRKGLSIGPVSMASR